MAKQPFLCPYGWLMLLSALFALLSGRSSLAGPCSLCAHSSSVGVRSVLALCLLLLFGCSLCARPVLALIRHKGIRMAVSGIYVDRSGCVRTFFSLWGYWYVVD